MTYLNRSTSILIISCVILCILINLNASKSVGKRSKPPKNTTFINKPLITRNHEREEEVAKQLKYTHKIENIAPDDHLDAVPIELDGEVNREMHKELFLGNHEDFETLSPSDAIKRLTVIFNLYVYLKKVFFCK